LLDRILACTNFGRIPVRGSVSLGLNGEIRPLQLDGVKMPSMRARSSAASSPSSSPPCATYPGSPPGAPPSCSNTADPSSGPSSFPSAARTPRLRHSVTSSIPQRWIRLEIVAIARVVSSVKCFSGVIIQLSGIRNRND